MDTHEDMLSMLLDGAVETLDIPPHLQELAVERYEEVAAWLVKHEFGDLQIYPQGSFRLGTVVRPNQGVGEFDIDLVFLLDILKESTTQKDLKARVGQMLCAYVRWKEQHGHGDGPKTCEAQRRCWTLGYPNDGFHLDVLPSIPDLDYRPNGILLTDKKLHAWQHSNPIGYANWFRNRSQELISRLSEVAKQRQANVDDVPEFAVRTTLQRVVQVLKWHAMLHFAEDPDNRPPSILITTLAAHAYNGEQDLFTATRNVLARMPELVENRDGVSWVPNPAHPEENFADKWREYPKRRAAFLAWHKDLTAVLDDLAATQHTGMQGLQTRMSEAFGKDPVQQAFAQYGQRMAKLRETGGLRMQKTGLIAPAAGTLVRPHTFHGQPDPDPRG